MAGEVLGEGGMDSGSDVAAREQIQAANRKVLGLYKDLNVELPSRAFRVLRLLYKARAALDEAAETCEGSRDPFFLGMGSEFTRLTVETAMAIMLLKAKEQE